jgi:hypothetical protein
MSAEVLSKPTKKDRKNICRKAQIHISVSVSIIILAILASGIAQAFQSTAPGTRYDSISSYEDLLRSQTSLIESLEDLLENTALNSSMSYKFLDSFDDLASRQQRGLYSFEDLVSFNWSELDSGQKIHFTYSYEDLLRRQAAIISSNEYLLERAYCKLGTEDKKRLLGRLEDRLKFEVVLLKKFEDWLHYQQLMEDTEYNSWIAFLSSFEDLIRRQSNLLDGFELLMKIDCTDKYINVTKSADSPHAGNQANYTYIVKNINSTCSIKNIEVKDSRWGDVGTIAFLPPGSSQPLTLLKRLSCTDCDNCTCKVCNFASACGEAITPNGNFTVCDISNEVCLAIEDNPCTRSGGTVVIQKCCKSASDFPNTCRRGICGGCSPEESEDTKVCDCGAGKCFNGAACVPPGQVFVGSIHSNVYHYPTCRYVNQILPQNLIWFSSSEDARAHGYRPCEVCKPP